jgi:hypothetical protein
MAHEPLVERLGKIDVDLVRVGVPQAVQSGEVVEQVPLEQAHVEDEGQLDRERVGPMVLEDPVGDLRLLVDQAIEKVLDEQMDREHDRKVAVEPLEAARQPGGGVTHGRGAEDSISASRSRRSCCQPPVP